MFKKIVGFVCVVLLFLSMVACSEKKEAKGIKVVPLQVFKQEITSTSTLKTLKVDEKVIMQVTVKNTGGETWSCKGSYETSTNRVGLGFYWIDSKGVKIKEGRSLLPSDLAPGASVSLTVRTIAPPEQGDYKLRFSMVQERVAWFDNKGAASLIFPVKVKK